MIKSLQKSVFIRILPPLLMALLVLNLGWNTPRSNFNFFIAQYVASFALFYLIWLNRAEFSFRHFLIFAVFLRVLLLPTLPELSNDFYRFFWDGELLNRGVNPFAHTPNQLMHDPLLYSEGYMRSLYHGMGDLSQAHYTCYPVLNQFIFYLTTLLSNSLVSNVIALRVVIILADLGAIYFAKKIADHLKIDAHRIWLYALNPFIILEFTGNLHFEGVMIFFLLGAIYALLKNQWMVGAIFFACAIQIKLLPLMLLPFVLKKLKWRLSIGFLALTAFTVLAIGGLMLNETYYQNMMESVNEYFIRFQFNGSISYLVSAIGQWLIGWEPLQFTGPVLSGIATFGILLLALLKAHRNELDIFKGMLFALMIYYSLTAIVHPWYISLILVLSIFTQYKFGLIWSFLVMLSYSAYADPSGFKENQLFIFVEYALVYVVLFYEIYTYWKIGRKKNEASPIGIQFKSFFSKTE